MATTAYVTTAVAAATIADASTTAKGKIQLAGDLGGTGSTAAAPIITDNAITTAKILNNSVTDAKISGVILGIHGGTGIDNNGKSITLGGNLLTSGSFATTLTTTAETNVTLPVAGTLATLAGIETLTNKSLTSPALTGTPTAPTALSTDNGITVATTAFVKTAVTSGTPDASTTAKGKIQLAGDLGGTGSTAAAPVITDNAITTAKIINNSVTDAKISGVILGIHGGTGIDNNGKSITLGGNLLTSGSFATTLTTTAETNVTLPVAGTLATLAGIETLTNKSLTSPALTGTPTAPTALSTDNGITVATTAFVKTAVTSGTPDASTTAKGKIQLAGDLGGTGSTAAAPVITDNAITTVKILNGAVTDAKLATIITAGKVANSATTATNLNVASSIVLRDASGNFSAGIITAALAGNAATVTTIPVLSGDVTNAANVVTIVANAVKTDKINVNAVTYAKIQNVTAARLLGNPTATAAVPSEIMVGTGLNLSTAGTLTAVPGSISITKKIAAYTVTSSDYTILCNTTGGGFTLTLPAATTSTGVILVIRKTDNSANVLTLSESILASETESFTTLNYIKTIRIQSDGANWYQID